jgi:hypothetical protein
MAVLSQVLDVINGIPCSTWELSFAMIVRLTCSAGTISLSSWSIYATEGYFTVAIFDPLGRMLWPPNHACEAKLTSQQRLLIAISVRQQRRQISMTHICSFSTRLPQNHTQSPLHLRYGQVRRPTK